MGGTGVDRAEPARIGGIVGEHDLQFVAPYIVEVDRPHGAVYFRRDEVVAAPGPARGLQAADGSIAKLQHRNAFILHINRSAVGMGGPF
jgi:hypothetical protein